MPKYEMPGWLRHWINNREANARAEIDRFDRVRDEARREADRAAREFEARNEQATRRRREWF